MNTDRQDACARNNALWCDAVLKSAGAATRFQSGFWQAEGAVLPLYPNIVTLAPKQSGDFYAALEALPLNAAVKDSYDCLDLEPAGFRKLQTATWLFRPERPVRKPPVSPNWHKVTQPEGLKKWKASWNGDEALYGVFSQALLENKTVDFAAIMKDGAIRAGAVCNSGPRLNGKDLLGLTNIFCRKNWRYSALHDLLEPFPHRPVCTYESNTDLLQVYRQLGFLECGSLGVWVKIRPVPTTDA
ncbi:hypothetical protein [Roseibium marinum]|uniref:N-acetyltransferase domain-containing protein n=1 Tax=Roseibium marinum TaxID=281252 RepID=A0A2S3UYZ2_9HYPH|nr:hypothetical protein [Roseibium marinum]POF32875.1 hypothetical protein CLV41_102280 [Roseibium marinum]